MKTAPKKAHGIFYFLMRASLYTSALIGIVVFLFQTFQNGYSTELFIILIMSPLFGPLAAWPCLVIGYYIIKKLIQLKRFEKKYAVIAGILCGASYGLLFLSISFETFLMFPVGGALVNLVAFKDIKKLEETGSAV